VTEQDEAPGAARRVLRWLSVLLLVGLMVGAGHQILRWEPQYLPIRVVTVDGELQRLSPKRLQATVIDHLHGGIVTQDLGELKEAVEALAWVRSASLRRVWPDRLDLTVVEHKPLCRWGEDGLVSDEGVVFRPPVTEFPKGLPTLAAVDERAPLLVARYRAWSPRFAARGLAIERMLLDARGAWSIRTDAGFGLALGKLEVEERAGRFLRAWPSLDAVGSPEQVDMRYSNGLSVRWNLTENGAQEGARAQAATRGEPGSGASGGRSGGSHPGRVAARIHDFLPRSPRS
jgi:cell division protein FtsQ